MVADSSRLEVLPLGVEIDHPVAAGGDIDHQAHRIGRARPDSGAGEIPRHNGRRDHGAPLGRFRVFGVEEQRVGVLDHVAVPADRVVFDRVAPAHDVGLAADPLGADGVDVVVARSHAPSGTLKRSLSEGRVPLAKCVSGGRGWGSPPQPLRGSSPSGGAIRGRGCASSKGSGRSAASRGSQVVCAAVRSFLTALFPPNDRRVSGSS